MKMKTFLSIIFVFFILCKDVTAQPAKAVAVVLKIDPSDPEEEQILPTGACGLRPLMDNPFSAAGSRIVGGHDSLPGSWPWLVSLQQPLDYKGQNFAHSCGGVIINQQWVVTTAHCFKGIGSDFLKWRLVLGASQLSSLTQETQIRKIANKITHKGYDPDTEKNDIALLLMDRPVSFNDYIQPACLPRKDTSIKQLTECNIAGWGVTNEEDGEPMDILQEAQVQLIDIQKCNSTSWYNGAIGKYNLCAGYEKGGIDSCQGDSGGPLMCRRPQRKIFTVVGITSWGYGCAQERSPGIYSSMQYFRDWMVENVAM